MRGGKVVSLTLSAALLAGMVGITGCGKNPNNNNYRTQNAKTGNRYDLNSVQNNRIMGLKYSPALSNKVSELSQIRSAQVLVTDRDAYVAVTLHGPHGTSGTGYSAKSVTPGPGNRTGHDGLGHGIGRSGVAGSLLDAARGGTYGSNGTGGTRTYGTYGADGRGAGTNLGTGYYGGMNGGISGNSYYSYGGGTGPRSAAGTGYGYAPGIGGTGTNSTGMNGNIMNSRGMGTTTGNGTMNTNHPGLNGANNFSSNALDGNALRSNSLRGTNGSYMNGTNGTTGTYGTYGTNGSYGTNGTGPLDNIPQSLKNEIERKIKATAPHIQNVHVSGHPEFVSRVSGYATQSQGGQLLRGVENDFSALIQRIFPSRTGTMTGPSGYTPTPRNTNGIGNTIHGPQPGNGFSGGTTR
ncbi:Lipoprotein YhcN precursor [compost metagenome]